MATLEDCIESAIEDLTNWMKDNPGDNEPGDEIFEIADSATPSDTWSIMDIALHNYEISGSEPRLGPAFDGKPTPSNIAAANIFEAIENALWEYWREHKDDYLDDLNSLWEEISALIDDAPQELQDKWYLILENDGIKPECKDDAESLLGELQDWDYERKNEH